MAEKRNWFARAESKPKAAPEPSVVKAEPQTRKEKTEPEKPKETPAQAQQRKRRRQKKRTADIAAKLKKQNERLWRLARDVHENDPTDDVTRLERARSHVGDAVSALEEV